MASAQIQRDPLYFMSKKIGIFGGTFDPIHFGHLGLAVSLLELRGLNEIWWIPAQINPLKTEDPTSSKHRLEMVKIGLEGVPQSKVVDIEIENKGPSYTVDTLRTLKQLHPDVAFSLILGEDTLPHFMEWKHPAEILQLASPLIGTRLFPEVVKKNFPAEMQRRFREGWTKTPLMEISATEIRDRLKNHLYCGHLVPAKVLDYITRHVYTILYEN
jgi:nicotinate-nucleotide adenylyltransferase